MKNKILSFSLPLLLLAATPAVADDARLLWVDIRGSATVEDGDANPTVGEYLSSGTGHAVNAFRVSVPDAEASGGTNRLVFAYEENGSMVVGGSEPVVRSLDFADGGARWAPLDLAAYADRNLVVTMELGYVDPANASSFEKLAFATEHLGSLLDAPHVSIQSDLNPPALTPWAPETFTVTVPWAIAYDLAGGTNNAANPEFYTEGQLPIALLAPGRDGYTFAGWTNELGAVVTELAVGSTGDRSFGATWLENVEVPALGSKVYNGAPQTADVPASDGYTVAANAGGTDVGEYAVTLSLAAGYAWSDGTTANKTVAWSITPATMTVLSEDWTGVYDAEGHSPSATASVVEGTTFEYSLDGTAWSATAPAFTNVVATNVHIRAINPNYTTASTNVALTVTNRVVTLTGASGSVVYSGSAQTLDTFEADGLVQGHILSGVAYAATGTAVGTYPGDFSGDPAVTAPGDADVTANYDVVCAAGALTITPGTMTISVTGYEGVYDGAAHPATVTTVDPADATVEWSVDGGSTWSGTAPSITDVGSQSVVARASKANYTTATSAPATLAVTQKSVTVTGDSATKVYDGTALTAATATAANLVEGHSLASVTLTGSQTNVGSSDNVPSGAAIEDANGTDVTANYAIVYANGTLEVTPATMTITVADYVGEYDGASHALAATPSVADGTTVEYKVGEGEWTATAPSVKDVADSTGVQIRATNANYATATTNVTMTVTPKAVTVAADAKSKVYDGDAGTDPALTATVTGAVEGETIAYTLEREPGQDVAEYPITVTAGENPNYTVAVAGATFTITEATITITIAGYEGVYDGAAHAATVASLVPADATVEWSVDDGATWSAAAPLITDVGTQTVVARASKANYTTATSDPATLAVTQKSVTVTATDTGKVYGETDPALTATVEGTVGSDTINYELSRAEGENVGTYEITASGTASQGNYAVDFVNGTFTITPAGSMALTVHGSTNVYDGTAHAVVATAVPSEGTTIRYSTDAGETWTLEAPSVTHVGELAVLVQATNANYSAAQAEAGLQVTNRWLTVTATDVTVDYGTAAAAIPYGVAYANFAEGEDATALATAPTAAYASYDPATTYPGTYEIVVSGGADDDYAFTYVPGTLTVRAVDYTITYDLAGGALAQGVSNPETYTVDTPTFTLANPTKEGHTFAGWTGTGLSGASTEVTVPARSTGARTYTATWTVNSYHLSFYVNDVRVKYDLVAYGEALAQHIPAERVKAGFKFKDWGAAVPETMPAQDLEFHAQWWQLVDVPTVASKVYNGEAQTADVPANAGYTVAANAGGVDVGTYAVVLALSDPDAYIWNVGTDGTFENQTVAFAITPATMTLEAVGHEGVYDAVAHAAGATPSVTDGTTVEYKVGDGDWSATAPTITDVGTVAFQVRATNPNYVEATASGTLVVTAKPVTVTADDKSKAYGAADPDFTATVAGVLNDDPIAYSLSRAAGEAAGSYTITPAGEAVQGNYVVTFATGTLTIGQTTLTVTANPKTVVYGDAPANDGVTFTGFVGNDDESVLTGTLAFAYDYAQFGDAGTYAITPGGLTSDDYAIKFVAGTLTVAPKTVGLEWTDTETTFNGAAQAPTATATGLVNGDTVTVTVSGAQTDVGTYTATARALVGDKAGNYALPDPATQSFEIARKPVTVTADDSGKVYGESDPALTAKVEGLVGTDTVDYGVVREAGEDVGTYAITASGAAEQGNYAVEFVNGVFTITPAGTMALTVHGSTNVYDGTAHAVVATAVPSEGTTIRYSTDAGETWTLEAPSVTHVGELAVLVQATNANYSATQAETGLKVTNRWLTVTATDVTVDYGTAAAAIPYGVAYANFAEGEDATALATAPTAAYASYDPATTYPGTYEIVVSGGADDDYAFTYVPGTLTVRAVDYAITYDLAGGALAEGASNPATYTVDTAAFTLAEPAKQGYTFVSWTGTGLSGATRNVTVPARSTGDRSYTATWQARVDTPYVVNHYKQDVDLQGWTLAEAEPKTGTTATQTAAAANVYEGFTAGAVVQATIAADGSTVVEIRYTRNTWTLAFDPDGGSAVASRTVPYGATLGKTAVTETSEKEGYDFAGWQGLPATMPDHDVTLVAVWKAADDTLYTVHDMWQTVDQTGYVDHEHYTRTGTTGEATEAVTREYTGFEPKLPIAQQTIAADGSTEVFVYYDRLSYTISFTGEGVSIAPVTQVYGSSVARPVPERTGYTFARWEPYPMVREMPASNSVYTAVWTPNDRTEYQVRHLTADLEGGTFTEAEVEHKNGTTDSQTAAVAKEIAGFTARAFEQETIAPDGTTVVDIYYDRNEYEVLFENFDHAELQRSVWMFGATPSYSGAAPAKTADADGVYTFSGWSPAIAPVAVGGATYTAQFTTAPSVAMAVSADGTATNWFPSLASAVGGAPSGGTVVLLADATLDARVEPDLGAGTTLVIDLAGHAITRTGTSGNGSAFDVKSGAVTIRNGAIDCTQDDAAIAKDGVYAITARTGAAVTLADLSVTVDSQAGACVYPFEGATVAIESGAYANRTDQPYQYHAGWTGMAVNQANVEQPLITITGGSFSQVDPALGDDSGKVSSFVDEDFISVSEGGFWVVHPAVTVTFSDEKAPPAPASQKIAQGAKAEKPADPAFAGWTFLGWFADGADTAFDFATPVAEDLALAARWKINQYAVVFKNFDGTVLQSSDWDFGATPSYSGATPAKTADADGVYTFSGWSPAIAPVAVGGATYTAQFTTAPSVAMAVSADGTATNWFPSLASAVGGAPSGGTVVLLADATLDARVEPDLGAGTTLVIDLAGKTITRIGTTGNGSAFDVKSGSVTIRNGTIDCTQDDAAIAKDGVYAITARSGAAVTLADLNITVDSQAGACVYPFEGATVAIESGTYANMTDQPYQYHAGWTGMAVNQANVEQPLITITGGSFSQVDPALGDDSGKVSSFVDEHFISVSEGGFWVVHPAVTVTFSDEKAPPAPEAQKIAKDATAEKPADPEFEGWTFLGWFADGADTAFDFATPVAEDLALAARWKINQYAITFDSDGGTAVADIVADFGADVTAPADPTKEGYTFAGWQPALPATMPLDGLAVTAQWTINQYTIAFDAAGGSAVDPITQDYATAVAAPANPTREGYTFAGWSPAVPATMPAEDLTLVAQWTINQYTVRVLSDPDGTVVAERTGDFGQALNVSAVTIPTKAGYTFKAWSETIPTTIPARDVTIWATWYKNVAFPAEIASKVYNGAVQTADVAVSEGLVVKTNAGGKDVTPDYPVVLALAEGDYIWTDGTFADKTYSFAITKATATVTAEAKSKTYREADPELTATVTGLQGEDTAAAIAYTLTRAAGEDVGSYAITPAGDAVQGNYDVVYVPANLTITKAAVTITVADASKTYGTADPAFTGEVEGLVNEGDLGEIAYVRTGADENVGVYAGVLTATYTANANYTVTVVPGDFEITAAAATVITVGDNGEPVTTYYGTLAEALAAAKDGDTVQLLTDIDEPAVAIENDITLDLNGHAWTVAPAEAGGTPGEVGIVAAVAVVDTATGGKGSIVGDIAVSDGGSLTLGGGAAAAAGSPSVGRVSATGEGSAVAVEGGTVGGGVSVAEGGDATVSGGTVNGTLAKDEADGSSISVTGGHFENDPSRPTNFVAEGYIAVAGDPDGYDVIARQSIEGAVITVAENLTYTGLGQAGVTGVAVNGTNLVEGTDYVVVYADNVNAGEAAATVVGTNRWTGTITGTTFAIAKAKLTVTAPDGTVRRGADASAIRYAPAAVAYAGFVNGEAASVLAAEATFGPTNYTAAARTGAKFDVVAAGAEAANYAFDYVDGTLTVVAGAVAAVDATEYDTIAEAVAAAGKTADGKVVTMLDDADAAVVLAFGDVLKIEHDGFDVQVGVADAVRYFVSSAEAEGVTTYTVQQLKADGLAIKLFDYEGAKLAYDMGTEENMAAMLPTDEQIWCTVVTATDLAATDWTAVESSRAWSENLLPTDDPAGWTPVEGLDTTTSPVRFFRIAVTPFPLTPNETVEFNR